MASIGQLVKVVADVSGMDEATVKLIARYVRESGFIGQQSTGGGAARMTSSDAASLLIAVNSATLAKEASLSVSEFRTLKCSRGNDPEEYDVEVESVCSQIEIAGDFGGALARLIDLYSDRGFKFLNQEGIGKEINTSVIFERPGRSALITFRRFSGKSYERVLFYDPPEGNNTVSCDRFVRCTFTDVTIKKISRLIEN